MYVAGHGSLRREQALSRKPAVELEAFLRLGIGGHLSSDHTVLFYRDRGKDLTIDHKGDSILSFAVFLRLFSLFGRFDVLRFRGILRRRGQISGDDGFGSERYLFILFIRVCPLAGEAFLGIELRKISDSLAVLDGPLHILMHFIFITEYDKVFLDRPFELHLVFGILCYRCEGCDGDVPGSLCKCIFIPGVILTGGFVK